MGKKANWSPAPNLYTKPTKPPTTDDDEMCATAEDGGKRGGEEEKYKRERDKGGKSERRLRAQLREVDCVGEVGGAGEAGGVGGGEDEWEEMLKGLDGFGGGSNEKEREGGGSEIDREADQRHYLEMRRQVEDQVLFPDEIDTPLSVPVQQRYSKYSAIGDIEKHVWDYTSDLPRDYKHIFQVCGSHTHHIYISVHNLGSLTRL